MARLISLGLVLRDSVEKHANPIHLATNLGNGNFTQLFSACAVKSEYKPYAVLHWEGLGKVNFVRGLYSQRDGIVRHTDKRTMRKDKSLVKILKLNKLQKTVDEDPASRQRWISERSDRLNLIKIEFGKPKDYCKADTTELDLRNFFH